MRVRRGSCGSGHGAGRWRWLLDPSHRPHREPAAPAGPGCAAASSLPPFKTARGVNHTPSTSYSDGAQTSLYELPRQRPGSQPRGKGAHKNHILQPKPFVRTELCRLPAQHPGLHTATATAPLPLTQTHTLPPLPASCPSCA